MSLKAYKRQGANWEEFDTYKRLNQGNSSHPGHGHMRKALGIFTIPLVGGDHYCLVQKPTWESFRDLLHRNPSHRFTKELGRILRRWLGYWANLLRVSSNAGLGATNFLRIMVSMMLYHLKLAIRNRFLTILFVGTWKAEMDVPQDTSLERSEEFLEGKNKEIFFGFYERDATVATRGSENSKGIAGGSMAKLPNRLMYGVIYVRSTL